MGEGEGDAYLLPFDSDELVDASVTTMATLVSAPPDAAPLLNMNVLEADAATMALVDAIDEVEAVGEDGAGGGAISVAAVATTAGGSMAVLVAPSSVLTATAGFSPSSASSARCFFVPAAHAWFCCTRQAA